MKKLLIVLVLCTIAAPALAQTQILYVNPTDKTVTRAEVLKPTGTSDTGALRTATKAGLLYQNTSIGPTAAIDTGVLDTGGCSTISWAFFNGNTTVARTMVMNLLAVDGVTSIWSSNQNAAAGGTTAITVGASATGGSMTAYFSWTVPPKFKITAAAPGSGTGTGSMSVWCR